jgi:hypothetical protein
MVETRRIGGKVKQEHVASLGSCVFPLSIEARAAFWSQCEARRPADDEEHRTFLNLSRLAGAVTRHLNGCLASVDSAEKAKRLHTQLR